MPLFNVGGATLALTDSAQFLLCDLLQHRSWLLWPARIYEGLCISMLRLSDAATVPAFAGSRKSRSRYT